VREIGAALGRDPAFSAVVAPKLRSVAKSSIPHLRPMTKAESWSNPVTNPPRSLTTTEPSGPPVKAPPVAGFLPSGPPAKAPPVAKAKPLSLRQGSGRPEKCPVRPLLGGMSGIPKGMNVMLDQLIGPPRYGVPYYNAPAYFGRKIWHGTLMGTFMGPVEDVFQAEARWEYDACRNRTWFAGMTCCCIRNPFSRMRAAGVRMTDEEKKLADELPEHVWVNVWCSQNNERQPVGISYCKVVYVQDETVSDYDPSPAGEPVPEAMTASRFQGGELQYTGRIKSEQTDQRSSEASLEPSADAAVTADPQGHVDGVVLYHGQHA